MPYHGDDGLAEKHYVSMLSRSQKGIPSPVVRDVDARLCADVTVGKNSRNDQLLHFVNFRDKRPVRSSVRWSLPTPLPFMPTCRN